MELCLQLLWYPPPLPYQGAVSVDVAVSPTVIIPNSSPLSRSRLSGCSCVSNCYNTHLLSLIKSRLSRWSCVSNCYDTHLLSLIKEPSLSMELCLQLLWYPIPLPYQGAVSVDVAVSPTVMIPTSSPLSRSRLSGWSCVSNCYDTQFLSLIKGPSQSMELCLQLLWYPTPLPYQGAVSVNGAVSPTVMIPNSFLPYQGAVSVDVAVSPAVMTPTSSPLSRVVWVDGAVLPTVMIPTSFLPYQGAVSVYVTALPAVMIPTSSPLSRVVWVDGAVSPTVMIPNSSPLSRSRLSRYSCVSNCYDTHLPSLIKEPSQSMELCLQLL